MGFLEASILWNHNLNESQRVIFSMAAEVYKNDKFENINHYSDLTELALKNIQKFNPDATKKSMGGWISKLNSTGLTTSIEATAVINVKEYKTIQFPDNGFELTDLGIEFIEKHYGLIEEFIKNNNIELYDYLTK